MDQQSKSKRSKQNLIVLIIALALSSFLYRMSVSLDMARGSVLFIGIPALLSLVLVTQWQKPKSLHGVVFRVMTLFLLISGILLGEGLICILVAAPIFYGVAGLIVLFKYWVDKRNDSKLNVLMVVPFLIALGHIGQVDEDDWRTQVSEVSIGNNLTIRALEQDPSLGVDLPVFFQLGFPTPTSYVTQGLSVGNTIDIALDSSTRGLGTLSLEIVDITESSLTLRPQYDTTHMGSWLTWGLIEIEIRDEGQSKSTVSWTSTYRSRLAPSWYFEPIEDYAVGLSSEYLIQQFFGNEPL